MRHDCLQPGTAYNCPAHGPGQDSLHRHDRTPPGDSPALRFQIDLLCAPQLMSTSCRGRAGGSARCRSVASAAAEGGVTGGGMQRPGQAPACSWPWCCRNAAEWPSPSRWPPRNDPLRGHAASGEMSPAAPDQARVPPGERGRCGGGERPGRKTIGLPHNGAYGSSSTTGARDTA